MRGVRAESVDRLGRKRDQLTVAQRLHGGIELELRRAHDLHHGGDCTGAALRYSSEVRSQPVSVRRSS